MTKSSLVAAVAATAASAAVVSVVLVGSDESDGKRANASTPAPWRPPPECPATIPNGSNPPGEGSPEHHGNGKLWTALGRRGTFLVAPKSAPEYYGSHAELAVDGVLGPDGSVGIKAPWWRGPGIRGRVRLQARRIDAPPLEWTTPCRHPATGSPGSRPWGSASQPWDAGGSREASATPSSPS